MGIRDGLAEPVGVRFGRYKYKVSALFSDKIYFRTFEGSACVFVTSFAVVIAHYTHFTFSQFLMSMILIPPLMTLAEALSPHTWDSPILFLAGYSSLLGVVFFL